MQVELHSWQPMAWLFDTLYTCEVWFNRHYGIMTRAWTYTARMCHYRTPLEIEADQYKGNENWKASWLFDLPVWVTLLFYFHICQWISNKDQCLGNGNHVWISKCFTMFLVQERSNRQDGRWRGEDNHQHLQQQLWPDSTPWWTLDQLHTSFVYYTCSELLLWTCVILCRDSGSHLNYS